MKIKKAILTGGGRATRLRPITTTINKHLIPLANKPMIFYAIEKAVEAGVEEIFINVNPDEAQLQSAIGDGGHWGIKIQFFVQEGGPQGIAHVVNCAKKFIGNDPFMFYLSDNILLGSLRPMFEEFDSNKYDCMLAFSQVPDPERFGVPVFDADKKLVDVVEKPKNPTNNFAVTGIYLYGPKVFFEAYKHIQKSPRGEYEISDIHSYLLKNNFSLGWKEITGWWKDTGKPNDLLLANQLLLQMLPPSANTAVPTGVILQNAPSVHMGGGLAAEGAVTLVGPVIIGENCTLANCTIGPDVTIGRGTTVKDTSISNSIIFSNTTIDGVPPLSESLVGDRVTLVRRRNGSPQRIIVGDDTLIEV